MRDVYRVLIQQFLVALTMEIFPVQRMVVLEAYLHKLVVGMVRIRILQIVIIMVIYLLVQLILQMLILVEL